MEVIGATASIIGIVGALKAIRAIWTVLNGIKDGPSHISELTVKMNDLQRLLDEIHSIISKWPGRRSFSDLKNLAQRCETELAEFERELLSKMQPVSADGRWAKLGKGLKSFLREDNCTKLSQTIGSYIDLFGAHLAAIGVGFHAENTSRLAHIGSTVADLAVQSNQHTSGIITATTTLSNNTRLLDSIDTRMSSLIDVSKTRGNEIHSYQNNTNWTLAQHSRAIDEIARKLGILGDNSAEQADTIKELLQQLHLAQQETPPTESTPCGVEGTKSEPKPATRENDTYDGLAAAIARLRRLAEKTGTTAYSRDADIIIEDLKLLLRAVLDSAENARKRSRDDQNEEESEDLRHLKRAKRLFKTCSSLSLSSRGPPQMSVLMPHGSGGILNQNRHITCRSSDARITVTMRNKKRRNVTATLTTTTDDALHEVFLANVTVMPEPTDSSQIRMMASIQQAIGPGSYTLKSTLSFSAVIPKKSAIFRMAVTGDLQGIKQFIEQGKASLWDCDPDGFTLLHYAVESLQPDLCRFLLQHGADPDCVGRGEHGNTVPLLVNCSFPIADRSFWCYEHEWNVGAVSELECLRLLLDAGADPNAGSLPALQNVLRQRAPHTLRVILERNIGFFHINEALDECGTTALLCIAGVLGQDRQRDCAAVLLEHGADISTRDEHGYSVLHRCICAWYAAHSSSRNYDNSGIAPGLQFLLRAGADARAKDKCGISVTELACRFGLAKEWEAALDASGHSPADICGEFYQAYDCARFKFDKCINCAQPVNLRICNEKNEPWESDSDDSETTEYTTDSEEPTDSEDDNESVVGSVSL